MKKVLLLCGSSSTVIYFRQGLISKLKESGCDVYVVALDAEREEDIKNLNVTTYCLSDENRSTNPLKLYSLKKKYRKIIKEVSPDVVMTFMLKPNTFGVLAAASCGVKNIVCTVEGAGDVFIHNELKWKVIRTYVCYLYKKAFKCARKVVFLNSDDKKEFLSRKLVDEKKTERIFGIGVNTEKFLPSPIEGNKNFLMTARMLTTKGIFEYLDATRIVKKKYPDAVFNYLGGEGDVKVEDIEGYINDGSVNYLGTTKDVRPYLKDCSVFVLPSYREGMPMSVMEALASGRPVITTDRPGCRELITDGYNGLIVDEITADKIAEKMIYAIEHPEELSVMGDNARKFVEDNCDEAKINAYIAKEIVGL